MSYLCFGEIYKLWKGIPGISPGLFPFDFHGLGFPLAILYGNSMDTKVSRGFSGSRDSQEYLVFVFKMYNMFMSYLEPRKKTLTEKQQKFLDCLVETQGDPKLAAELAGYSGNHQQVLKSLKDEVIDLASEVLARSAPRAAFKLIEVMESNRPVPQANNKLQAAQNILDRVGVTKTERLNVNHTSSGGIFILPEKQEVINVDYEDLNNEDIPN